MTDEYDIFISYAHIDNEPLVEGMSGWVSAFHAVLEKRLAMLLGERVRIWRDKELRGNDVFDETIAAGLHASRVLITILTPRYVKSDYCKLELREFWNRAAEHRQGGSDKVPIFKVLKTPIPIPKHPEQIKGVLGYEFYEADDSGTRIREYSLHSSKYREKFIMALDDLAQEIGDYLELQHGAEGEAAQTAGGDVVYLAPATSDMREHYDTIRRELLERGCRVLPDRQLPLENEAFCEAVREGLDRAKLSVHIVGARYGIVPEEGEASTIEIQLDLGAQISAQTGRPRLIWMPPDLEASDDRQRTLIDRLQTEPAAQQNAEILLTSIEELKSVIREKLETKEEEPAATESAPDAGGPRWVYVIYEEADQEDAAPLVDHLWEAGFEVRTPMFDGEERELREEHEENLCLCDAFLVYYGHGNERWIRKALADMKKAPGLGRTKPTLARTVYLGPPESPGKTRYRSNEATVLRAGDPFDAGVLAPFREALGASLKGSTP